MIEHQERALWRVLADAGDRRLAATVRGARPGAVPEWVNWRDDRSGVAGTVGQIADYYRGLARGRLVIAGEPGTGKTMAATQLVVTLARGLTAAEPDPGSGERLLVPVLFDLTTFTPGFGRIAAASDQDLAELLDDWMAGQLVIGYGILRLYARRLVTDGWVLPVLDGLDEMDLPSAWGRMRANAVLKALNARVHRPAVLVGRTDGYAPLASGGAATAGASVLHGAHHIVLQRMTVAQVRDYLTCRFPDPDMPGAVEQRWQPVLDSLTAATRPGLAEVLCRPWRLSLAAAAYHAASSEPVELTRMPPGNIPGELMARLIPAVTARRERPGRSRGHYDPGQVRAWLVTMAQLLRDTGTRHGWPAAGLAPERLWPIAGWRAPRYWQAALNTGMVVALLVWAWSRGAGTSISTLAVLGAGNVGFSLMPYPGIPPRSGIREDVAALRGAAGRYLLTVRLGAGLALGLAVALPLGLVTGFMQGYQAGLMSGGAWFVSIFMLTYLLSPSGNVSIIDRPSTSVRRAYAGDFELGVMVGIVAGTMFGVTGGVAAGIMYMTTPSVWPRYWIAVVLARRHGIVPGRPVEFLDWACSAGLLRLSGTDAKFRHHEFQDWLGSIGPSVMRPGPGSAG